VSFVDHDLCRRCGTPDGPSHTSAECERVRAQRAEVQRAHAAAKVRPSDRCGAAGQCAWMRTAIAAENTTGVAFIVREMEHPDTLVLVTRVVGSVQGARTIIVRACPACGGNPNEETVCR
jgi:hypothetical protein